MTWRYGWSKLSSMELADTPSVARGRESQKILTKVHNQEVIVWLLQGSALVERFSWLNKKRSSAPRVVRRWI